MHTYDIFFLLFTELAKEVVHFNKAPGPGDCPSIATDTDGAKSAIFFFLQSYQNPMLLSIRLLYLTTLDSK